MAIGTIKAAVQFKQNFEKIKNMIAGFQYIRSTEVVVGITEESNVARENGMTNSALLYLHENGVPSHNIPPRPVLRPAIAQDGPKTQIQKLMKDGMREAILNGNVSAARQCYEKAGMVGRDACKKYISDGTNLTPNAPATIALKMKKGNGDGEPKPLIDTGSMLGSITYAVRGKK